MSSETFDVVIIGAGPAGYVCAIRAAQLKLKTALIEKESALGGTCLRVGCIPSKALLDSSEHFHFAKEKADAHGIELKSVQINIEKMMTRKEGVVKQLTQGVAGLIKKNKVSRFEGSGKITQAKGDIKTVEVTGKDKATLQTKNIVIATGSEPVELPFLKFGDRVGHSTHALSYTEVPKHLVVIGGGVIGLELGSVWHRLGAKVSVIEFADALCPSMDRQLTKEMHKTLSKQGLEIHLSTKCLGAESKGDFVIVETEDLKSEKKAKIECDQVLVSTGRRPYTEGLGLEGSGVEIDKRGVIQVNDHYQTALPGVYAIGDCIPGPMLAHKGEEEGVAVAEILAGQSGHVNYDAIPSIIYTWPEVASVGKTEEELKNAGVEYRVGQFPFLANGRAKAIGETEGFVKILEEKSTFRILGAHVIGPHGGDLIQEVVNVMEFGGSAEDLARTCHAHPTLSEVVKEAALDVDKRRIHL